MKNVPPLPKRLIICCDGTWQSSVSGKRNIPSNVARLARAIARAGQDNDGKVWQQVVYYDSGVGTGSLTWFEQARQGGTGDGLVVNVLEAYNFLVNNYAEGDQIFCFGFSRGAFTARAIAGLVTDIGVFRPENMQSFAPLWALYQRNLDKHDFVKTKEYFQFIHGIRPMCEKSKVDQPYHLRPWEVPHDDVFHGGVLPLAYENSQVVEVVGVFDTVGSLGLADTKLASHASSRRKFEYLNVKLSPFINHAFHALALDDHREPFLPTLWYIPSQETLQKEKELIDKDEEGWDELRVHRRQVDEKIREHQAKHKPDLYQVWFPGVHINIGGGSDEASVDAEGLSNITFAWMVQQLGSYLAFQPWTWSLDIGEYQLRIMRENQLYESMKKDMTREEKKQYEGLMQKSRMENIEDTLYDLASWIVEAGKKALSYKEIEMVPVPPDKIVQPPLDLVDDRGNRILPKWGISQIQDSYTPMYYLANSAYRAPGESRDRSLEHGQLLKDLGRTNEYIHPSVWWRSDTIGDQPQALNGFRRQQDPKYHSWGYYKKETGTWIPEWFMIPSNDYLDHSSNPKAQSAKSARGQEGWQHAEWTYTDNVDGTDELQKRLTEFYIDTLEAAKRMEHDGKGFPFEVPRWK